MREVKTIDLFLLLLLGVIWGSSFFNIKIATYSYEPITLALTRVIFASIPLVFLCFFKKIKILAFSKDWFSYALIGLCNIVVPFVLIAIGTTKIDSYLAAILMSTTPISSSILAHFFTQNEKITFFKSIGIIIGFSGVIFLFLDKLVINDNNLIYALIVLAGSTFYAIGGILTLKIKKKGNENVTTSTILWSVIFLIPLSFLFESPLDTNFSLVPTLSLIYLGVIATGGAWLLRFKILTQNGLVFQSQVAYLIPVTGVFFGFFIMNEVITWKVLVSLFIIISGIFIVKKNIKSKN
ncbi:DMT family transporter [Pelagibacteraceae bacterium]|jgi:drug/metabolite transporter (DMT)-like permease|nr:DMT family transporter [Pelagibacteraceae bacterium]|tara:strand:+ start:762 stop:1646 length:885 start_codon:yes stop_codon:yes gene_type:complete